MYDNLPYQLQVRAEILVQYDVSESDNLRPRNLRVPFTQLRGYATAGLAEQGEAVQDPALNEGIPKK